ncbi:hypothetical protein [Hymenobacter wooponensis]|uniref:Haem-binding uptake Tiki superfamily ChaN domain-containing protein n=1 Tax=Hymenobacter wooponensis TaxID=1525360 RepID=A0A4Z0MM72_9BACT|nr:hypothetical protein [Hymenobacter wooponensis]TGD80519.1 hypothetical protein EU557_11845 [Hymenobacter wooponensis]
MKLSFRSATTAPTATFSRLRQLLLTALAVGMLVHQAQAQDSTLTRLVHKYQYGLTQTNGQFSGTGWEKLQQDIRQSQLVLVGEDHGMAQIPVFTTAVAQVLKPAVYVAEIDKYQAQKVNQLAAQPGLPTAFERQHPMGLSFYSWAEEFELARYLRTQKVPVMGIDQVSLVSTGTFFADLAGKVKNKSAKAYLANQATAYQAQDRLAMVQGTNTYSIYQRPSALDSLQALVSKESPEVQQMVRDFRASSEIYQLNATSGLKSHQTRINLMKRNLLQGLEAYQKPGQPLPKMLFKFGGIHVSRGVSLLGGVYDMGNMALNLADVHDQKSLHIFIIGKQGTKVGGFNPDDFSKNIKQYTNNDEAALQPFMAQTAPGTAWQVFDLRPLRRALINDKLKVSSQELATVLLGYDYVIIIPKTTASHNY